MIWAAATSHSLLPEGGQRAIFGVSIEWSLDEGQSGRRSPFPSRNRREQE